MNIPPSIILGLAVAAVTLFVVIFVTAAVITFRNRRIIKRAAEKDERLQ